MIEELIQSDPVLSGLPSLQSSRNKYDPGNANAGALPALPVRNPEIQKLVEFQKMKQILQRDKQRISEGTAVNPAVYG